MDKLRAASVVDGELDYDVVDYDAQRSFSDLTVDPTGRPWVVYAPGDDSDFINVAHKEGDQWIIEQITVAP